MTEPTSAPSANATPAASDRRAERLRHPLRFRRLQVLRTERPTPQLVRITLGGPDIEGFTSPGFDDHMKLFFPDPATGELRVPVAGPDGPVWPEGPKPPARDYTPHHHDATAGTLQVDFVLHEAGPATAWARAAQPGDALGVGGPRGSFIVPTDFDWHLLIGDETGLPAIARRLAELPPGAVVRVLAEVDGPADEMPLPTRAAAEVVWVHRESDRAEAGAASESQLLTALRAQTLPAGDFHAWVGCESTAAKALRAHLVQERGARPQWIRASGYWRRGAVATHDTHDE